MEGVGADLSVLDICKMAVLWLPEDEETQMQEVVLRVLFIGKVRSSVYLDRTDLQISQERIPSHAAPGRHEMG